MPGHDTMQDVPISWIQVKPTPNPTLKRALHFPVTEREAGLEWVEPSGFIPMTLKKI